MFSGASLTAWNLLTATGALLAFLMGLAGLVGRERKSPYVVNTIIVLFIVCLIGASVDLASLALSCEWADRALYAGAAILLLAFLLSLYRTYKILLRLHYLVDHVSAKNLPILRHWLRWFSARGRKPTYQHDPLDFPKTVQDAFAQFSADHNAEVRNSDVARSICIKTSYMRQMDSSVLDLSILCLTNDVMVQYLCASRHPIEFVDALSALAKLKGLDFGRLSEKLVVIDAYSKHYAFLDSVYPKRSLKIEGLGVELVTAKMSYAGVHTAASQAFNLLKKNVGKDKRLPSLVIYEDLYALADLESPDQYRIFVRHVLPSERLFGGMLTLVLESVQPEADWSVLQAQADVVIDMTSGGPKQAQAD